MYMMHPVYANLSWSSEQKYRHHVLYFVHEVHDKESLQVTEEPKDSNEHDVYKKAIQAQLEVFECPV